MRIVSLIASATEIVHQLGLGGQQVGRSHECDFPESVRDLPVCTRPRIDVSGSSADIDRLVKEQLHNAASVYEVFDDVLEALHPTHILTQSQCRVCAVSTEDVESALSWRFPTRPAVVTLEPNSLDDIWNDMMRVGSACGVAARAAARIDALRDAMRSASESCRGRPAVTVACVEWIEPLMAAGNWTPELITMANGNNLFGEARKHSPWLEWRQIVEADPDAIIVAPCGFDLPRTASEMYWLTNRPDWPSLRAVRTRRVFLADGNQYFNRPGPRVVDTLRILIEILHPAIAPPRYEGRAWLRLPQRPE